MDRVPRVVAAWAVIAACAAYGRTAGAGDAEARPPAPRPFWALRLELPWSFPARDVTDDGTAYDADGDRTFGFSIGGHGGLRWRRVTLEAGGTLFLRSHETHTAVSDNENHAVIGLGVSGGAAFWPVPQVSVGVKAVVDLGLGHPDPDDDNGPVVYGDVNNGFYRAVGGALEARVSACAAGCKARYAGGVSVARVWFHGSASYGSESAHYEASGSGVIVGVFMEALSP